LLLSLIAALRITGWAGAAHGVDPGRPGVPEFGRKLYHLPPPKERSTVALPPLREDDAAAIERKSGLSINRLVRRGELEHWHHCLQDFRTRLTKIPFLGVVLDYDGTIVDTRERFVPPKPEISDELIRILDQGGRIAVATGRGASVRRDLRTRIPQSLWSQIALGYYNGAEIGSLAQDDVPDGAATVCEELASLALALQSQSELAYLAEQTNRRYQITLQARRPTTEGRLWDLAQQVVLLTGHRHITITRSSHSIDVLAAGVSKLAVLKHIRGEQLDAHILTIGDRGRWPGNDYELLREPLALSVDEVSVDPSTCWNLAPRGQRGIAATLGYLRSIGASQGALRFRRAEPP
jgi:hydroxymethylpyrimidine pyrophosphatase-like HAD family hydrolase